MTMRNASRARGLVLLVLTLGVMFAFSSGASAFWLETQLAGIRLGDSAFVLYENPVYGEPEAIVIATSGAGSGPVTSGGFDGANLGGTSSGEGSLSGGAGGAGGPFGGGGAGSMGMGGPGGMPGMPGMMGSGGGSMMGPMMGPPSMGMMTYSGGNGETQVALGSGDVGVASGFWGTSSPGTLNTQTGGGAPSSGAGGFGPPPGFGGGGGSGPPMSPGAGRGGFGPSMGAGGAGGLMMGMQGPGAGAGAGGGLGGLSGALGGGGGNGSSLFQPWALSVWFDLRQNEMEYFYMVDDVAVGFVINKIDGKIVAISVAGEDCEFARTAMWKPHEYVQLGDSFKQVQYRYGWPHEIETFVGTSDNPVGTPVDGTSVSFAQNVNEMRRDCILYYHEVRGEKQCNVAFTLHDFLVTRIHIWIPEPI